MSPARSLLVAMLVIMQAVPSRADPWYSGPQGRRRVVHASASVFGGALYLSSETFGKATLAPAACRWCDPTGYDIAVRNALVWRHPSTAATLSNLDGFVVAPGLGLALVMLASRNEDVAHVPRWIDDTLPIVESGVIVGLLNQGVKFTVAEQRPFVHFGDPRRIHELDDDVSFFSGHTTLAFAVATSAGIVAHERHYSLEPVIWAAGYSIALSTGYLRIAGDQHYLTDVATGAVVGVGVGLFVPLVMHGRVLGARDLEVVPTRTGVALSGAF